MKKIFREIKEFLVHINKDIEGHSERKQREKVAKMIEGIYKGESYGKRRYSRND